MPLKREESDLLDFSEKAFLSPFSLFALASEPPPGSSLLASSPLSLPFNRRLNMTFKPKKN